MQFSGGTFWLETILDTLSAQNRDILIGIQNRDILKIETFWLEYSTMETILHTLPKITDNEIDKTMNLGNLQNHRSLRLFQKLSVALMRGCSCALMKGETDTAWSNISLHLLLFQFAQNGQYQRTSKKYK